MKAIIEVDIPDYQIGQEVSIYFKDTMMIKGVVQEPSGDLISRQAVIDILDDMTKDYAKSNDFEKVNGIAWVKVQKLPSVNPQEPRDDATLKDIFCMGCEYKEQEPKTGHWIKGDINEGIYCSECNENALTDYDFHYIRSNFCPNCGAEMSDEETVC